MKIEINKAKNGYIISDDGTNTDIDKLLVADTIEKALELVKELLNRG